MRFFSESLVQSCGDQDYMTKDIDNQKIKDFLSGKTRDEILFLKDLLEVLSDNTLQEKCMDGFFIEKVHFYHLGIRDGRKVWDYGLIELMDALSPTNQHDTSRMQTNLTRGVRCVISYSANIMLPKIMHVLDTYILEMDTPVPTEKLIFIAKDADSGKYILIFNEFDLGVKSQKGLWGVIYNLAVHKGSWNYSRTSYSDNDITNANTKILKIIFENTRYKVPLDDKEKAIYIKSGIASLNNKIEIRKI